MSSQVFRLRPFAAPEAAERESTGALCSRCPAATTYLLPPLWPRLERHLGGFGGRRKKERRSASRVEAVSRTGGQPSGLGPCTPRLFSQRENEQRGKCRKERREKARRAFPVRIPPGLRSPGLSGVSSLAAFRGLEGESKDLGNGAALGPGAWREGTHLFSGCCGRAAAEGAAEPQPAAPHGGNQGTARALGLRTRPRWQRSRVEGSAAASRGARGHCARVTRGAGRCKGSRS